MFELLRYRIQLRKLKKMQPSLEKEFNQTYKKVVKEGNDNDGELSEIGAKQELLANWIEYEKTKYQINICNRLVIPLPKKESGDIYYQYNFDDGYGDREIFTVEGFSIIRKLIREERKEKSERFGFYSPIIMGFISMLIGVIGAIIALVSVLK